MSVILGLWTETSLHAGSGSTTGIIDLPIQRESHNGWPCVYGSAVKGALRAKAEALMKVSNGVENESITMIFGPSPLSENGSTQASEHAGALLVSDARLLLLPVRSLTSHFKWVTCPALLKRLKKDSERLNVSLDFNVAQDIPQPDTNETAIVAQDQDALFLEEYRFLTQTHELERLNLVLEKVSGIPINDIKKQLVIISDNMFNFICQSATPVTAHISIDNEKKVVKKGQLWYEETLPPETVLYSALSATASRMPEVNMNSTAVLESVKSILFDEDPYLQLGGNETVGMGWCKVNQLGFQTGE